MPRPVNQSRVNPNRQSQRATLRTLGWILICVGVPFFLVGVTSFFGAFNNMGAGFPDKFWCAFVGLPLIGFGIGMLKLGYLEPITRYVAGEVTPVGTDALAQIAEDGKGSARQLAQAVGEGLRAQAASEVQCPKCGEANEADARFCDDCGAPLGRIACAGCGHSNDANARFCNRCGQQFTSRAT